LDSIEDVFLPSTSLREARRMIPGEIDDKRLGWIVDSFRGWLNVPAYLTFHSKEDDSWYGRRASKRGNYVYRMRVEERLEESCDFLCEPVFLDAYGVRREKCVKGSGYVANVLFIDLTCNPVNRSRRGMWEGLSKKYNRFITAFRKRYGKSFVMKVVESTCEGSPHFHLLLACENSFPVFPWMRTDKRGKEKEVWLVECKDEIAGLWKEGFVDVQAVSGGVDGARKVRGYLFKDLLKQTTADLGENVISQANLTLGMNWFFRKRSFSVSGKALKGVLTDMINNLHNSNRKVPVLELVDRKTVDFMGVFGFGFKGSGGSSPFSVFLPGDLVRSDDRFKVLRDKLAVREGRVYGKTWVDDWKDTREEQLDPAIRRALWGCYELLHEVRSREVAPWVRDMLRDSGVSP
jgi:hypothetical protein